MPQITLLTQYKTLGLFLLTFVLFRMRFINLVLGQEWKVKLIFVTDCGNPKRYFSCNFRFQSLKAIVFLYLFVDLVLTSNQTELHPLQSPLHPSALSIELHYKLSQIEIRDPTKISTLKVVGLFESKGPKCPR